jgi:hypothetical protein
MTAAAVYESTDAGIPRRTCDEWCIELASLGMRFCDAEGRDTTSEMWARGFASGALLPYHRARERKGVIEVSYDGRHWRVYDPKRDRGLR